MNALERNIESLTLLANELRETVREWESYNGRENDITRKEIEQIEKQIAVLKLKNTEIKKRLGLD